MNHHGTATKPPSGTFLAITLGLAFGCGLRTDHTIACWGEDNQRKLDPPPGTFEEIEGNGFLCARRADRSVECWGKNLAAGTD